MKVRILPAQHAAPSELISLYQAFLAELIGSRQPDAAPDRESRCRAYVERVLHPPTGSFPLARVAEVSEQPVGLAVGWLLKIGPESVLANGAVLWVTDLYVKPEYRRAGIGPRLLESLLHAGREQDVQEVHLQVPMGSRGEELGRWLGFTAVTLGMVRGLPELANRSDRPTQRT